MTERLRSASTAGAYPVPKMESDLSPRKTLLVLVIVVGCFAVLWPKVFYPMLVGSANQHLKPSPIDKATGCCDVISETDVHTIKIMSELCGSIVKGAEDAPLTGKEVVRRCRQEVLDTCGIDISLVLQEQVRLGQSVKQILDEVRSLNGSLCLKYNYGVAPWRLGVPHRVTVKTADSPNIRQERPMHLRSELVHPAFRERGRAIPQPQPVVPTRPPPRVVEGRPGPIPGMRPTIGGAGHVVPPSKQGTSSMSVIMPIYTIGIVIFFTYTLIKIIFKKQPDSVGGSLYPPIDPDPNFRKEVFESESSRLGPRLTRENISSKLVVNAMSALLDEVDQEIEARRKSSEVASQDLVNGTLSNGDAVKPHDEEQPTVKVLGMEMTASCEGGKKWSRPDSSIIPTPSPLPPAEPGPPPQEIYLEGALPAQSHLLVAESATNPEPTSGEDPAVVLSGKMTLSVISLDSDNGTEEPANDIGDVIVEKETVADVNRDDVQQSIATNIEETVAKALEEIEEQLVTDLELLPEAVIEDDTQKSLATNIEETVAKALEEIEENLVTEKVLPEAVIDVQKSDTTNVEAATESEEKSPITVEANLDDIKEPLVHLEEKSAFTIEENLLNLQNGLEKPVAKLNEEIVESVIKPTEEIVKLEESVLKNEEDVKKSLEKLEESAVLTSIQEATVKFVEELLKEEDQLIAPDVSPQVEKKIEEPIIKDYQKLIAESIDEVVKKEEAPTTEETEVSLPGVEEGAASSGLDKDIEEFLRKLREESDFQAPTITLESDDVPHTLEVESLEKEVDDLIQEALESIQQKEIMSEISSALDQESNEISNDLNENETIEKTSETSQPQTVLNDTPETKEVISANIDLKKELSSEIEKLIKEVKDLPVVEPKLEVKSISQETELAAKTHTDEKVEPTQEESLISEKIEEAISEVDVEPSQEKLELLVEPIALAAVSQKPEESTTIREENSIVVPPQTDHAGETANKSEEKLKVEPSETFLSEETTASNVVVEEKIEKVNIVSVASPKIISNIETVEEKPKVEELTQSSKAEEDKPIETDDEELGSDEELVEEIEEIVYEEESGDEEEEEIEIEVEESDEEIPDERNTNRTESSSVQRVNGERSEDLVEESKYTTVSGATAAENEISDEELTDDEEEEIIEVEEEIEDESYVNQGGNGVNHVSGDSEPDH